MAMYSNFSLLKVLVRILTFELKSFNFQKVDFSGYPGIFCMGSIGLRGFNLWVVRISPFYANYKGWFTLFSWKVIKYDSCLYLCCFIFLKAILIYFFLLNMPYAFSCFLLGNTLLQADSRYRKSGLFWYLKLKKKEIIHF